MIESLYKQAPSSEIDTPIERVTLRKKLMMMVESSLTRRTRFESQTSNPVINCVLRSCSRNRKRDFNYLKARHLLASELDIKRILKTLRYLRNAVRLMTTADDRKLLRMQAKYHLAGCNGQDTKFVQEPLHQKTL